MLKLGAQLYTVRDYMKTEADFAATIEKIAGIGYKYAQVSGIGAVSPKAISEITRANGIEVTLTHWNADRIKNETQAVIAEHDLFGCNFIGIGAIPYAHTLDGFMQFCKDFAPAIKEIKAAGKVFLYHNHRFEFEKFDGKTGLELILENTDPDGLKLTFDTYWAQSGGADSAAWLKKFANRIGVTHLKDMAIISDKQEMTEIMTGNINFDSIIKVSQECGINYHFVEQDEVRMNAFDSLEMSYKNLMSTGAFE